MPNKEEIIIRYLQPGVEYCVTVAVKTLFNSNAVTSAPHCAFTSPPQPLSSRRSQSCSDACRLISVTRIMMSLVEVGAEQS